VRVLTGNRRDLAATAPELTWALRFTGRINELQGALAGPSLRKRIPRPAGLNTRIWDCGSVNSKV